MMVLLRRRLNCFPDLLRVPPRRILITPPPPPELPDIMQALQHAGHKFQTVSFNSWKFAGSQARIKKECSVCFSVDTVVTSQDIVVGFDKAGIDIDNIVSIQRKASNNTWIVSFNSKVARDAALNEPNVRIAGCMVFLGDCENRVSIVKLYELPVELPDSVVIGRLSHYGKVYSFRRDRLAEGIFNGVRTARMIIDKPIPSQAFIAGEFARIWYPSQPKTCRKCGAEGHLAAACSSQRCFNCEQPGHRSDECPLPPLCRVCLAETHSTTRCPFIYYSSNISMVEPTAVSYAKAAEKGKEADETKRAEEERNQAEEKARAERARREERAKKEERDRARKEREESDRRKKDEKDRKASRRDYECRRDDRRDERRDRREDRREDKKREERSDRERERDRDRDRSARDRSSHRYHDEESHSSSDDDDGWITVRRKSKSRSY